MGKKKTYLVELAWIFAVSDPRIRGILAKKALAAYHAMDKTSQLRRLGVTSAASAEKILAFVMPKMAGFKVDKHYEPTDPSDDTAHAISLEEFCEEYDATEKAIADEAMDLMNTLMLEERWSEATEVAIGSMNQILGYSRVALACYLEDLAPYDPGARLFYAKAILEGDVDGTNEQAESLLQELVGDDDPDNAGYAHILLGLLLEQQEGRGWEAMRSYESAGNFGWEYGYERAGEMLQFGANGVPVNLERAVRNYRRGAAAEMNSSSCMARLAVLVLSGEVPYMDEWKVFYQTALDLGEELAIKVAPMVSEAEQRARGDRGETVRQFSNLIVEQHQAMPANPV